MHQTYIFLTETILEKQKLEAVLCDNFFKNHNSFNTSNLENFSQDKLEFLQYQITSAKVIIPEIDSKKDFTGQLFSFYQNYPSPSILFLGNLNQYSLPMQEGMLKILEEPPENLYIVLTAEYKAQILATITSRSNLIKLPEKFILAHLDTATSLSIKEKMPIIKDFYLDFINDKFSLNLDFKKLEREEINLWLWQLEFALRNSFKQKNELRIAQKIEKILYAKILNNNNLQKKFVFEALQI